MGKTDGTKGLIQQAFDKALVVQQPLAERRVAGLRRSHPDDTPQDLIRRLDRHYLFGVTVSGGASGAAGIVPGTGIPTALADVLLFTEASVLYTLSLAEVHGTHPENIERRRLLVLTVLLGDRAITALDRTIGRTGPYWARRIVDAIPMSAINRVNKVLGRGSSRSTGPSRGPGAQQAGATRYRCRARRRWQPSLRASDGQVRTHHLRRASVELVRCLNG